MSTKQVDWRSARLDGAPIQIRTDVEGWWHILLANGERITARQRDEAYRKARAHVAFTAAEQLRKAAPAMLVALQAAEHWLQEERDNPGQATPDEILRVIGAAIAAGEGRV